MNRLLAVGLTALTLCNVPLAAAPANASVTHALISGSGSSWAANAINQWISDVSSSGLQVVYTSSGSAQGRTDFRNATVDYAVSDIGFQGVDSETGASDTNCSSPGNPATCRDYAYLPIAAGGTSFPYQIRCGTQQITNLRLSGETLTKIFTNKITNWDDPAITADNNGRKLCDLAIIPVVHSEGSGTTAQFSRYMDTLYPSLWRPFAGRAGLTEYFPRQGDQVAENGSDGVINFITSAAANGAIGYDEYSYALGKGYPVVALENKAGYFTLPTQYNVAVALTKAQIDYQHGPDYLLENLDDVYTMPDKRAYAMSSYSYMIIPTSATDPRMTTPKRQTLADFLFHDICAGQAEIGPIGYSPLPINLVEASFKQTDLLHTADPAVQISNENVKTCHNPTFVAGHPDENYLAKIAPEPPACAKAGAGPCTDVKTPTANPGKNGKVPASTATTTGTNTGTSTGTKAGTDTGSSAATTSSTGRNESVPGDDSSSSSGSDAGSDPDVAGSGATSGGGATVATTLSQSSNGGIGGILAALAVIELLAVLAIPPLIARRIAHRRSSSS